MHKKSERFPLHFFFLFLLLLNSCTKSGTNSSVKQQEKPGGSTTLNTQVASLPDPSLTPGPSVSPAPQLLPVPTIFGPDEFPDGFNPLTGQRVSDPAQLDYPALLLSISHFPPVARPQAGFSFTPWVYEYYITEGSTRHLAVFYGEFPEPEIPLKGECEVRSQPLAKTDLILGNRIWHDKNQDGIQEPREEGIGGLCINLLDTTGTVLQRTSTDSNGYYGFNVVAGTYVIEVGKPSWFEFTQRNVGDESTDSDVDPATGRTEVVSVSDGTLLFWDAGLVPSSNITPTPDPSVKLPAPEVGPIRSGRIFFRYMGRMYQDSCMIYASADQDVLKEIPGCATVAHTISGGGAMLPLERMQRISEQNKKFHAIFNYASNLFTEEPPAGGVPAVELREYWALLNQSKFTYDAASGSWWRYVDRSNMETAGALNPLVDRLNGRQVQFENVILLIAQHIVITPTIVDIDLSPGNMGNAYLFRDGQMYQIKWSTFASEYEKTTGRSRPIQFTNTDGTPAALKPGHTWVVIFGLESYLEDLKNGVFRARFVPPEGAKVE